MPSGKAWREALFGTLFALILWQILAMVVGQQVLLASPLSVAVRLWSLLRDRSFLATVLFSLSRIAAGFLLAFCSAVLLAGFSYRLHFLEILLRPLVSAMKTIPVASFIVLSLLWFRAKSLSIFISFLMVFPVIYTGVLSGLGAVDQKRLEMAGVFRVPWLRKLRYLVIPEIRPYLLSASKVALGLAWKSGVAAEVIGIPRGSIGERLYNAKLYLDTEELFAWTVVIVAVSLLFERCILAMLSLLPGKEAAYSE